MKNLIHVGGAQGVGKTTIIDKYLEKRKGAAVFEYGKEMIKMAKDLGFILRASEFYDLDPRTLKVMRANVLRMAVDFKRDYNIVFVDSHYVSPSKDGLVSAFDGVDSRIYDSFVLVEADPMTVVNRVGQDEKYRTRTGYQVVSEYMAAERKVAEEVARSSRKELIVVNNDNLEAAVKKLAKHFKR